MKSTAKVAVSIPLATLRRSERARRRLRKSRSAVVTEALEEWLAAREMGDADRRYVEGYARLPETPEELAPTEAMAIEAMSGWEPWT